MMLPLLVLSDIYLSLFISRSNPLVLHTACPHQEWPHSLPLLVSCGFYRRDTDRSFSSMRHFLSTQFLISRKKKGHLSSNFDCSSFLHREWSAFLPSKVPAGCWIRGLVVVLLISIYHFLFPRSNPLVLHTACSHQEWPLSLPLLASCGSHRWDTHRNFVLCDIFFPTQFVTKKHFSSNFDCSSFFYTGSGRLSRLLTSQRTRDAGSDKSHILSNATSLVHAVLISRALVWSTLVS
jgi:hypothetical protein